ncbi:tyrosine-type recombinase/integrase [Natronoglycomyces albus]|uniref:Tyrosine-type recombinase/integrase n=1 Tax=Natronoglycomyces albus TaxID=2811108 RepID=A0A895XVF7_9ACTN|nr:tyrosine-type recombinase/integrase [Natronoglycomyces albus]QSB06506.1 tyrosine-type recombinase/integrase [Natronoglycomyces albus]
MPGHIARAIDWVETNSPPVSVVCDYDNLRELLDQFTRTINGKRASANYFKAKRTILYNTLKRAVVNQLIDTNPLDDPVLNWEKPAGLDTDDVVDPRSVGNTNQVEAMLTGVTYIGRDRGPHLMAFYACMYYAMMRPSEVIELKEDDCELPRTGWGELVIHGAAPEVGSIYTDTGASHDEKGLKGRNPKTTRTVPIPPRLVELLRAHLDRYSTAPDGRLFYTRTGNRIGANAYRTTWRLARQYGMSKKGRNSGRLKRSYDLRHSGISLRRTAGVPSKQVAEWAGHTVEVLEGYEKRWQNQMNEFF